MLDIIIFIIETIGTIAFAVSGVLTAMERRLDLFGAIVLAGTAAVGGGVLRDIILGRIPPQAFTHSYYVLVAFATACIMLVIVRLIEITHCRIINFMKLYNVCDAMGLGIFSVLGADAAFQCGHGDNLFLTVFVGVVTGVGGGILRDLLAGRPPVVMRRDIYAICSITGTILFFWLRLILPTPIAMLVCAGFIFVFRMIMIKFRATLPLSGTI